MAATNDNPKYKLPYLDDFLLFLKTQNYSEETVYNYDADLKHLENFLNDENKRFEDLDKQLVNQYKVYLVSRDRKRPFTGLTAARKLEPRSVNRALSALRTFLKYFIDLDKKVPLPPDAVKLVKTDKKHPQVAELDQLIKLIESPMQFEADEDVALRNRAMLEVLISTGMRISELVGLNRSQLDGSGRLFIRGKGRKERFVYLTPRASHWLNEYLERRNDAAPAMFVPKRGQNAGKSIKRISTNYLHAKIIRLVHARLIPDSPGKKVRVVALYYHCKLIKGSLKPGGDFKEAKWVPATEVNRHFTTSVADEVMNFLGSL